MSSANPERWTAIEAVLDAALKVRPEERDAVLAERCAGDPELRREVESLLSAHASASDFLSMPAESFAAPFVIAAAARESTDQPGTVVGRYRLVERIGRGGMGDVWLAERADGHFERRVALKLVKRGMDTDEILARFLRERQILARLEHPNIARLLDGGASDDGRPYFVMEHVAGRAITDDCDARRCTVEERLQLFIVTARAVGYAHRNLVVHRDIKPANVLVDERGEIKLLDFGIARVLSDDADGSNPMTGAMGRLMTPEYASPEQVAGGRVTTASDVYQLGVLLYELVCGQRPRNADATANVRPPSTIVRSVSTETHLIAVNRGITPDRLSRRLRGDLDTIVLRALRDEAALRYPSAEDLAEDVERHLTHRPIRFGGDRAAHRISKFIRRHRLGVAATAGVLAITVGLSAVAVARVKRERDRAIYESDKATEVAQLMARFLQGWSPDASDRGEVSTRKLLADAALRAERELQGQPEILGATLSVLGDFHTTIGVWPAAESLLARAQAIQQSGGDRVSADLAATLARRGRLLRFTGDHAGAMSYLQRALALDRERFGPRHPETLRVQRELSVVLRDFQRYAEAEPLLRDILGSGLTIADPTPFALETATELAYMIYQQGRFDEAIAILRPTLERQLRLFGEVHVSTLSTMRSLGSALRDRGDLADAEALYRRALRVARALYGNEHPETESATFLLALVLERKRDLDGAEELLRQSLELAKQIYGPEHPLVVGRLVGIAAIRLDQGDSTEAEQLLRRAQVETQRLSVSAGPDQGDVLNRLAFLLARRRAPDANRAYRAAVAFDDGRPASQADFVTDGLHFLAWVEHRNGDLRAAEVDYRRALAVYERHLPSDHPYRVAASEGLAAVQRERQPVRQ